MSDWELTTFDSSYGAKAARAGPKECCLLLNHNNQCNYDGPLGEHARQNLRLQSCIVPNQRARFRKKGRLGKEAASGFESRVS
jgi:hypothetical protein